MSTYSFSFFRRAFVVLAVLACTVANARGQSSTTATLRGHVEDPSGAVLPGVTMTLTDTGTKAVQTTVTDSRGQYLFSGVFPGTYDMKAELPGFKTYQQTAISLSPNDTRGLDVKLEIGQQTQEVTVTATPEIIQTETGAREGVLSAKQIDNLSVIGRSSLELLRILPGVVADFNVGESVSFGGGANNTQGYTVNGIRSSGNTVQLDGSSLIDIGSNSGVIVTLNNDMVSEVKVQSSNFAAEYGAGGMNVSAVTKAGSSKFHGEGYDYWRNYRFASNDASNVETNTPKPKSTYNYPGGNVGGPLYFGDNYTKNHDKLFFFVGLEGQRQQVDSGAHYSRTYTDAMKNGDFSQLLSNVGSNLNSPAQLKIPQGFLGAGNPAPNNNMAPYITPMGKYLASLYPSPNFSDPNNLYNYVYSRLEPSNRIDFKSRFDWNITNRTRAYVRIARESEQDVNPRGVWWGPSDVALPSPNVGDNVGRSFSGNVVSVLSSTMTNEALVSYSRLTLDNHFQNPSLITQGAGGVYFNGIFPQSKSSPYLPTDILHGWGGSGQVGNLWAAGNDVYAHNDSLQFSDKITKLLGTHGMKFGVTLERGQKQQNFQNLEAGQLWFADPGSAAAGTTGNSAADMLVGRIGSFTQGTAAKGNPSPGQPYGDFRFWNTDAFAQDSWKVRSNLTLEYGVRFGYWTNNQELNGLGGYFNPSLYNPNAGVFLDPGTFQKVNGVCYVSSGCAPAGIVPNRGPFGLPRVNAAWDIDGKGNNVLRGGFGMFYNRNMGNVEYDNTLRLAPNAYQVGTDVWAGGGYGAGLGPGGTNLGLTYDTVHEATLANRIGTLAINTLNPNDLKWPTTYSFSVTYERRIPFNQIVSAAYVGTRGRDLVSRENGNVMPYGAMMTGTFNGTNGYTGAPINLSDPVNRYAVATDSTSLGVFRPFNAFSGTNTGCGGSVPLCIYDFHGVANYDSLQATLSRPAGRRLQYFVTYTLSKNKGTLGGEYSQIDPYDPARTYGVLPSDRTHTLNVSWTAFLPDGAKSNNAVAKGALNGWQLSGITSLASGIPITPVFSGAAANAAVAAAYFGTPDVVGPANASGNALAPVYTCDPRTGSTGVGQTMLNINCITFPAFGQNGSNVPKYDLRTPTRTNTDLTVFKNFSTVGDQHLQVRFGFFNLFNQSFANTNQANDINLTLDTTCNVTVPNVPTGNGSTTANACDVTKGFSFTPQTIQNFGKINITRGHRVVEFVLKYYF